MWCRAERKGHPYACCPLANYTDLLTPVLWTMAGGGSKLRSYFSPFVDRSSSGLRHRRGRDRSLQRRFPIVDVLFRSGDIRDRAKSSEIAPKKASSIANISGMEQDIDNWKTALQTTISPASADIIRWTLVHKNRTVVRSLATQCKIFLSPKNVGVPQTPLGVR